MLPDLIRAPNHLGDLVMALPALAAAPEADVVVARWLAPLAALLPRSGTVIPLDRGRAGMLSAARALRRRGHAYGVLLPPSLSSALLFRLAGVRRLRGAATDRRTLLLSDAVPRARLKDRHRALVYLELVTGGVAEHVPVPVLTVPAGLAARWAELHSRIVPAAAPAEAGRDGAAHRAATGRAIIGIFPGSNAPSRRWDAARFAAVVRDLVASGMEVLVFGAVGEAALTRTVAGGVAADLGGRTDLPMLAAGLAACDILVTNDSGPMHLAAAVGTRTLVVSGPADTRETAPGGTGHVYLQRLDLPCVPCVKNECPRRGAGFILPEAERECLRLIGVPDVLRAIRRMLSG
jgi:heptosyltransferase II